MIVVRCRHCRTWLAIHGSDRDRHRVALGVCTAAACRIMEARRGYRGLAVGEQNAIYRAAEVATLRRDARRLRADARAAVVRGEDVGSLLSRAEDMEQEAACLERSGRDGHPNA